MLGWSINLFRIRGILISLNFSFVLMLAYICNDGWNAGGLAGLLWSGATFLAFFTCVVLHELGHSFTAMGYGIKVRRIVLMVFGGVAELESIPRRPVQELWITLAGPAVNFVIAGVLWLSLSFPPGWDQGDVPLSAADLLRVLAQWNLIMGIFNLLPAFPMDGGRILRSVLAMKLPYLRATFWAATVGKVVTLAGIALSLYFQRYIQAGLFFFIFLAGESEYRAVKRREIEEARWRQALELHLEQLRHEPSHPIQEPPKLEG